MQRTIVVGDVHGCADELQDLLRACGYARGDRVVMVGDVVAKGPDSQAVVQWLRENGGQSVLGNHDAHALKAYGHPNKELKAERQQLLDTLTRPDWAFLEALPLFLRLGPERAGQADTVVVHGVHSRSAYRVVRRGPGSHAGGVRHGDLRCGAP